MKWQRLVRPTAEQTRRHSFFVAPSEYYYDRYAPTVEGVFASVKVPDAPGAKPAS